jgi:hypothetical protein
MSITATCGACGKTFIAPSQFQGKRVKCKGCGQIFTVPSADVRSSFDYTVPGTETDPLAELAAVATSDSSQGGRGVFPASNNTSEDLDSALKSVLQSQSLGLTPNVLTFDYPGADDVDRWLPLTIIIVGCLLLLASTTGSENRGVVWISLSRFLTPLVLYTVLIFPITLAMLRKAGRTLKFAMPPNLMQRCFACYFPAFMLVLWTISNGFTIAQFFAGVLGLIISTCLLWLLFRLREEQFGTMVVYGAGGFVGGATLTILLMLALNQIGQTEVTNEHSQASVPVSPIADGLRWAPAAPAPVVAAAPAKPAAVPATNAVATAAAAAPTVVLGSATLGSFDLGGITGVIDDVISPLNSSRFVGIVRRKDSAASVECWDTQTWKPKAGVLQLPGMPAGGIVISTDGQHLAWIADFPHLCVQVWSFDTSSVTQTVDLDRSQGHPVLVGFIGPDQLLIDRTMAKSAVTDAAPAPAPADHSQPAPATPAKTPNIFDMDAPAPHTDASPPADPAKPGTPAPRFEMFHQFSVIDAPTAKTICSFNLPVLAQEANATPGAAPDMSLRFGRNIAISVVSQRLAAAIRTKENPSLIQIDLSTGQPLATVKIPEVDPGMSGTLTGLAFSNDGKFLAALFENGGSALLLSYDSDAGTKVSGFVYPAGPLDGMAHGTFDGSAICWLDPAPYWLVYGQGMVSTKTGAHLKDADFVLAGAVAQRYCDQGRIQIIVDSPSGKKVCALKLDQTYAPADTPAN